MVWEDSVKLNGCTTELWRSIQTQHRPNDIIRLIWSDGGHLMLRQLRKNNLIRRPSHDSHPRFGPNAIHYENCKKNIAAPGAICLTSASHQCAQAKFSR